jgi:hypothetical protein
MPRRLPGQGDIAIRQTFRSEGLGQPRPVRALLGQQGSETVMVRDHPAQEGRAIAPTPHNRCNPLQRIAMPWHTKASAYVEYTSSQAHK